MYLFKLVYMEHELSILSVPERTTHDCILNLIAFLPFPLTSTPPTCAGIFLTKKGTMKKILIVIDTFFSRFRFMVIAYPMNSCLFLTPQPLPLALGYFTYLF